MTERLWANVVVGADDECWPWSAYCMPSGYGQIRLGRRAGTALVHRVAYADRVGPIPDGLFVCHTCDNPPCCNPNHLFLGDQTANMRDARTKGRLDTSGLAIGRIAGPAANRARAYARDSCVHGHRYTPETTSFRPNGQRRCLVCSREENKRRG